MTALLTWLKSFIDLQKAASITVPGVVGAFAIILFAWPTESLIFQGYTFPTPADVRTPAVCDALSREAATASGSEGRMSATDYSAVQARRWQIEDCVRQLQALIIGEQQTIASLAARIAAEQKRATEAQGKYAEYRDKFNSLAESFRREAQRAQSTASMLSEDSKGSEARVAYYTNLSARWNDEQKEIVERLKAVNGGEVFADIVGKVTQRVLYVAILAITIGFILDPLNRAFFNVFYSPNQIRLLNALSASKGAIVLPPTAKRSKRDGRKIVMLNINYALGLKLISQDDVDALQNRYYYTAQLTIGLILPTALLLAATALFLNARYPDQSLRHIVTPDEIQRLITPR